MHLMKNMELFMKIWKYKILPLQVIKLHKICAPPLTVEFEEKTTLKINKHPRNLASKLTQ